MSQCIVKRIADTTHILKNDCLPTSYIEEVDITQYLETDIAIEYEDTQIEAIKANSRFEETYVQSYKFHGTYTMKMKAGTFVGEYFDVIDAEKKAGNLEVMNNFTWKIIDPFDTEVYTQVYMEITKAPFQNVESKEWIMEFVLHGNGEPIITANPGVTVLDNPQTANVNLDAVANGLDAFDLTFDTTVNSLVYNNMKLIITQDGETYDELITDGSSGSYTTSANYDTTSPAEFTLSTTEIGYSHLYDVGKYSYTPAL